VMYPRTFDFRDSWVWSDIEKQSDTLTMKMFNDWEKMSAPSSRGTPPFRHTTFTSSGTIWADDSRPYLAATLDREPIAPGAAWLTGDRIGGYWTKFISEVYKSGEVKKIIDKHAKAHGLIVTSSLG